MSLDISIKQELFHFNITHNLTEMASKIKLQDNKTLYDILWRGDENGIWYLEDMYPYLKRASYELIKHKENLKQYNPNNGWGHYRNLVRLVENLKILARNSNNLSITFSR